MSRRVDSAGSRARQAQSSNPRAPLLKLTMGGKSSPRGGRNQRFASKKTIRHTNPPSGSDAESTTSGEISDDPDFDEETDDADDESEESEEPEVDAPSHLVSLRGGAGSPDRTHSPHPFSEPDTWTGFPDSDGHNYPGWLDEEELKKTLFDSDDDQVYERVNEVSDSENENDEDVERAEEQYLESQLQDEFNTPWASHFANQIDGMSAYGFGDEDSDEGSNVFAFSGSDDLNDSQPRRVRFEERQSPALEKAMAVLADSPTISRSLLPAALSFHREAASGEDDGHNKGEDPADDYDSDATAELVTPATARPSSTREKSNVENTPPFPTRRSSSQKGPVRGTFEDSGEKVTAILDSTGKKLLLSDPHLLGGVFARRFGPSVPGSPSVGFSEAVFGESDSSEASLSPRPSMGPPILDLMLPGLTSGEHASMNGHATGLPEAFLPVDSTFLNEMCPRVFDDEGDDPEKMLQIQDMIQFDGENESEDPDSRIPFPSLSAPSTPLAHLNHMNVSAFKRKAEIRYTPHLPNITPLKNKHLMSPAESSPKRKRKSDRYSSPYKDAHYNGVTPVQRMAYQEYPSSPAQASAVRGHKRRKTMW